MILAIGKKWKKIGEKKNEKNTHIGQHFDIHTSKQWFHLTGTIQVIRVENFFARFFLSFAAGLLSKQSKGSKL